MGAESSRSLSLCLYFILFFSSPSLILSSLLHLPLYFSSSVTLFFFFLYPSYLAFTPFFPLLISSSQLPDTDAPYVFCLPDNIERSLQRVTSAGVIRQLRALSTLDAEASKFDREKWRSQVSPVNSAYGETAESFASKFLFYYRILLFSTFNVFLVKYQKYLRTHTHNTQHTAWTDLGTLAATFLFHSWSTK